jgi:hypothetical protein
MEKEERSQKAPNYKKSQKKYERNNTPTINATVE